MTGYEDAIRSTEFRVTVIGQAYQMLLESLDCFVLSKMLDDVLTKKVESGELKFIFKQREFKFSDPSIFIKLVALLSQEADRIQKEAMYKVQGI